MDADQSPLSDFVVTTTGSDGAIAWAAELFAGLGACRRPPASSAASPTLRLSSAGTPTRHTVEVASEAADAVTDWARSGVVTLTGRSSAAPLVPPGRGATAARGAALALEALSALFGTRVRVDGGALLGERASLTGLRRRGSVSPGGGCRILPTDDGWLALGLSRQYDLDVLPALVQGPVRGDPWAAAARWARRVTAEEAASRAQLLAVAAAAIPSRRHNPASPPLRCAGSSVRRSRPARPLVVDLSALWAGPLCAQLLGLAGCRIVKVESVDRPDGARSGPAPFYDLLHAGHETVALDLGSPSGLDALRGLLSAADVVVEASRPRALEQFGIDAAETVAEQGTTWLSLTAYGRTGQWPNRVGFGDDVACAAGLVARDGRGVPVHCGDAIADPLGGIHAAVAGLAGIVSGRGGLVDVALRDIAAATLGPGEDEGSSPQARRAGRRWQLETQAGPVEVARPRARPSAGAAAPLGAHTDAVLAELAGFGSTFENPTGVW